MIPNTQEEFLADTVRYYTENVDRRCHRPTGFSGCYYSPENAGKVGVSEGCAIGRHLTKANQKKADQCKYDTTIQTVYDKAPELFPKKLVKLGIAFLGDVQHLHDSSSYWNLPKRRMSKKGRDRIKEIIKKHGLDAKKYQAALKG